MVKRNETRTKGQPKESKSIEVQQVSHSAIKVRLIGTTPFFHNRMSAKVMHGLLVGSKKKTAAERANIKHDPFQEYRDSAHRVREGPTVLGIPVVAIKSAMCDAAIETPGMTKTGTQRLLYMPAEYAPLYGIPQLRMDVVRSADMNRTPDIRTRCFMPTWGCELEIRYVTPQLSASAVVTLAVNAGILIGVGDFRQQKGKGAFGTFRVIGAGDSDPEWKELVNQGRSVQEMALKEPEYANDETADLVAFYQEEKSRRDR